MALEIDGFSVLRSISTHPGVFEAVKAAVVKAAADLVIRQIKGSSFDLENLTKVESALGNEAFTLIIEQLPEKDLLKILKKVDPNFPGLKTAEPTYLRTHFQDLACGRAVPAIKQTAGRQVVGTTGGKKKALGDAKPRALSSKAMGAKRRAVG